MISGMDPVKGQAHAMLHFAQNWPECFFSRIQFQLTPKFMQHGSKSGRLRRFFTITLTSQYLNQAISQYDLQKEKYLKSVVYCLWTVLKKYLLSSFATFSQPIPCPIAVNPCPHIRKPNPLPASAWVRDAAATCFGFEHMRGQTKSVVWLF